MDTEKGLHLLTGEYHLLYLPPYLPTYLPTYLPAQLDDELDTGVSGPSDTYGNTRLSSRGVFKCLSIEIWGFVNRLYLHHSGLDMGSAYKGRFPKSFTAISEILSGASHVVDLSTICRDGGGSQYTFLEAIYHGVPLILHKKWIEHPNSIFKDGVNCRAVSNAVELVDALKMPPLLATELLEPHLTVSWLSLFPSDAH